MGQRKTGLKPRADVLTLALCLLLGACAHEPAAQPRELDHGWALERSVIDGLIQIKASAEQRVAVLAVFDRIDPPLRDNNARIEHLHRQWAALDAQDADYAEQKAGLIQQRLALFRRRLELEAEFDEAIAAILEPAQWQQWREVIKFERPQQNRQRPSGQGEGQGRRRPRRISDSAL